ncbi:MAG: hypothetical protein COV67_05960 [Nitrospinae bacterium CG11_big_fil_rev_8_21_14_0_20_56_8]|nr:MAG: hypothetical protein COV67_05960 [Nitrospinae bacterium CG11_big_fil_rev_8_21_14_0_20_56_8]
MIGAIELLMIAIIFGIIYSKDAIDKTFKKRPDEGVVESFTDDLKDYYEEDPKRLFKLIVFAMSVLGFLGMLVYWAVTKTRAVKMFKNLFNN